jgi:hypothetical protein
MLVCLIFLFWRSFAAPTPERLDEAVPRGIIARRRYMVRIDHLDPSAPLGFARPAEQVHAIGLHPRDLVHFLPRALRITGHTHHLVVIKARRVQTIMTFSGEPGARQQPDRLLSHAKDFRPIGSPMQTMPDRHVTHPRQ